MSKTSIFLTCLGAIGVAATAILAARETPKAMELIKQAESKKGEKLSTFETVKVTAPAYIPAILVGATTVGCIFGANVLNTKSQATLASAYALADQSYKRYRERIQDLYGEETDRNVKEAVAQDAYEYEYIEESDDGKELFFDFTTMRYFRACMEDVIQKEVMDDGMEYYIVSTPYSVDNYFMNTM